MCFAPKISIATALIEFAIAGFIWLKTKRTIVFQLLVMFIFLLGFYQFTEFMLCETNDIQLWGTLGFVAYTFLPPLGVHFALRYLGKQNNAGFLYILPVAATLIAVATKGFIIEGYCSTIFVVSRTLLSNPSMVLFRWIYLTYYFAYIVVIYILLVKALGEEKNKTKRVLHWMFLATVVVTLLAALVLIVVFPALKIVSGSIYCEFALLFALMSFIAVCLYNRKEKLLT